MPKQKVIYDAKTIKYLQDHWNVDMSRKAIAEKLGTTLHNLKSRVAHLRGEGYTFKYSEKSENRDISVGEKIRRAKRKQYKTKDMSYEELMAKERLTTRQAAHLKTLKLERKKQADLEKRRPISDAERIAKGYRWVRKNDRTLVLMSPENYQKHIQTF